MTFRFKKVKEFTFVDTGENLEPKLHIVLLHGLLGNPEGWQDTFHALEAHDYRVIVPRIPIDRMPMKQANTSGITRYVRRFTSELGLETAVLVGNSLGGQIALEYTLQYPESVSGLILSGSSGVYEVDVGTTTFRRRDRSFIRARAETTFFDPTLVSNGLVERIYELANDRSRALRILRIARSSMRNTLSDRLCHIRTPTLLIWGVEDHITPRSVAETFESSMHNAELHFIERCGHAPMIEHPERFNELSIEFLKRLVETRAHPATSV